MEPAIGSVDHATLGGEVWRKATHLTSGKLGDSSTKFQVSLGVLLPVSFLFSGAVHESKGVPGLLTRGNGEIQ